VEFLGDRGTADHGALLQDRYLQPRSGQVGGADQAIVTATDN
jgi:hypothetical protein